MGIKDELAVYGNIVAIDISYISLLLIYILPL